MQHISRLFILLAGLIILAHAVVPHHHHFEISHSQEEETSCEEPMHHQNSDKSEAHCHAFNLLVSEKSSTKSLKNSLSTNLYYFLKGSQVQSEVSLKVEKSDPIYDSSDIFKKSLCFSALSFRGPPTIA